MTPIRLALLALLVATPALAQTPTLPVGSPTLATGQASVGTSPAVLVPARIGRMAVTIENTSSVQIFIGGPGVTPSTGFPIPGTAGSSLTVATGAAIYAVTASGTAAAAFVETF